MLITPIVIACSVGFLTVMYNYAEKKKHQSVFHPVILNLNGVDHHVRCKSSKPEDINEWVEDFCSKIGTDNIHLHVFNFP